MRYQLVICMLITSMCEAYKVKVRNHTDKDIEVLVDLVKFGKGKKAVIKSGERGDIEVGRWMNRGIKVKTIDGKRTGEAGPNCSNSKTFVYKKTGKEYYANCKLKKLGSFVSEFYDVFLPQQGVYLKEQQGITRSKFTDTPIKDTNDNLIVTVRSIATKY